MNMKKNIIIGVVALLLAVSVGYALFSDTLNINGTAKADGTFQLTYECQPGMDEDIWLPLYDLEKEQGYKNDTCSVNGDTINFSSELEYPGATRYFTIKVTNNGSINAVLSDLEEGKVKLCIKNDSGSYDCQEYDSTVIGGFGFINLVGATCQYANGNFASSEVNDCTNDDGLPYLRPGYSLYFLIKTNVDSRVEGENNSLDLKYETSYKLPFVQETAK